ncbi:hypothetical protein B0H14DRAFT_2584884 [Mycena olivaceomarginata]|nr:hypothetical protein B0H14DRAFT_2584884 [Mycena olivaceomarginata]
MVDISLESAFHSLEINPEPFFHPRKGFESRRGSETENFYVVMKGRIPGIYTHWEDASPQVNTYPSAVHKKHLGWSAAMSAWDGSRRPSSTPASLMPSPSKRDGEIKTRQRGVPFTTQKKPEERAPASVPPPTPTASKRKFYMCVPTANDTTIYTDEHQASAAARRGMADGSFRKVDVTTGVQNVFDRATESALEKLALCRELQGNDLGPVRVHGKWGVMLLENIPIQQTKEAILVDALRRDVSSVGELIRANGIQKFKGSMDCEEVGAAQHIHRAAPDQWPTKGRTRGRASPVCFSGWETGRERAKDLSLDCVEEVGAARRMHRAALALFGASAVESISRCSLPSALFGASAVESLLALLPRAAVFVRRLCCAKSLLQIHSPQTLFGASAVPFSSIHYIGVATGLSARGCRRWNGSLRRNGAVCARRGCTPPPPTTGPTTLPKIGPQNSSRKGSRPPPRWAPQLAPLGSGHRRGHGRGVEQKGGGRHTRGEPQHCRLTLTSSHLTPLTPAAHVRLHRRRGRQPRRLHPLRNADIAMGDSGVQRALLAALAEASRSWRRTSTGPHRAHASLAPGSLALGGRVENGTIKWSPPAYHANPAAERPRYSDAGGDGDQEWGVGVLRFAATPAEA